MPVDARYFDVSRVADAPEVGGEVVLARFELSPDYCGLLEYFSQWTDAWAKDPHQIETPDIEWSIRVNQRPFDPYLTWKYIANPWGYGSFPVSLRLDNSVTLEFVARGVIGDAGDPFSTTIAAGITGGPSVQLVTPTSLTGITSGGELVVDTNPNQEVVRVISVFPPSFAAVFQRDHQGPVTISGVLNGSDKVNRLAGRLLGRYWYNAAYGDVVRPRG
jgi:hypothetical protein